MPTPANRAKIQLVRGSYANILASIADLVDGELCYAKDQNKLYMVEGSTLTPLDYLNNVDVTETVQDLIGSAISGGVGLTSSYNDTSGITTIDLDNTTVSPGSYGSSTSIPSFTVDAQGRITAASTNSISTDLSVAADSGTNQTISLGTETLTISGDTGITTTTTTNGVNIDLDDTTVSPGTYGSSTSIPSFTVDQQGRITSASTNSISTDLTVAADSGSNQTISLGSETFTISGDTGITTTTGTNSVSIDLDDTTVTPGTYGSSTAIPSITVDQQGRITSATTNSISTDLTVAADSGANQTISLGSETFTISGDTGITTTTGTNSVSIDLDDTGVTPATYGDADSVAQFTVDQQGRITSATNVNISLTSSAITDFGSSVRTVTGIDQTFEPMGHADRTDSTISFNTGTRTFSIAPVATSYDIWCKGVKYTKTGTSTVAIPNTSGLYYIYFDSTGTLQYRTSYFDWDDDVPTSYIYWNATTSSAVYLADERHGITLDWATHEYLHRTRGAVIANGFSVNNYTITGDGTLDAHAQIDLSGGTFFDEDLEVAISHSDTPTANTWEQDLQGPAKLPVFYLDGSMPEWKKDTATNFPLKQGTARPQYNKLTSGTWSTVDAASNRFIINFVLATHNLNEPVIVILGQNEYTNIGDAEAVDFEDLVLTGFPSVEFRPLYKLVFQVDAYGNAISARLRSVIDIRNIASAGVGQAIGTDHGALSGLGDDDHQQYLHATENRTGVTANINTSGTLKTTNSTSSTSTATGALVVTGGAGIGGNVNIGGDLTVNGATVTLNTETILVEDKNIELGVVATPTDTTANSGGITLKGSTDKTISWLDATDAWTFSEHVDLASGKAYYINGASVLNSTTLGSGVVNSSLTSVGTIATGTWNATTIGYGYGGTGYQSYTSGQLLIGKTDGSLAKATLTAGSNVSITNGDGAITIASTDTTYTAGDGLDLTSTSFSLDLKANGGLVIESTELALDLGASSITGTLGVGDGGTGLTTVAKGAVLVANASNVISALDGGGATDGYLFYDAATDTISWVTEVDGGFY